MCDMQVRVLWMYGVYNVCIYVMCVCMYVMLCMCGMYVCDVC